MSVGYQILLLLFCLLVTGGNIVFATLLGMLIYWGLEKYDSQYKKDDPWDNY